MFYKKADPKTFALTTGKHLCWSLFLIVLQTFMGGVGRGVDLQACNLIKKRFFCYQCQIFKTIIYSVGHETIYFEKYLRTAASENLSDEAILIFRRYFRSSSLPAFCKVSVFKTTVKFLGKHLCWIFISINLQILKVH